MDRIRRIAGMGKAKVPSSAVQKDRDESIVFFRELYKREKDRDVNLLEPMYSVEFDAIRGGHMSKAPSGKRDFLIPVDEKHDYDWLKTPPAMTLFPSLEMEANSSLMVFQKELPRIPRPVKSSALRLSSKPEATKTSMMSMSPTPDSSSKRNFNEKKNPPSAIDKRSSYTTMTSRQNKAVAATTAPTAKTASSNATKKHSDRCYASQGSSMTALKGSANPELPPYKAPKNLITTGSIFARRSPSTMAKVRSRDPALGKDGKVEDIRTRRQQCPPAATTGAKELQLHGKQNVLPAKGKPVTGTSGPAANNGGRAGEAVLMKGLRKADGKKEQRQKLPSQAKK